MSSHFGRDLNRHIYITNTSLGSKFNLLKQPEMMPLTHVDKALFSTSHKYMFTIVP
jgi:hypothetical protein